MYKRRGLCYSRGVKNVFGFIRRLDGRSWNMVSHKALRALMRLLCALIDYLVLMLPV